MLKYICVLILIQIFTISEAQDSLRLDSTFHLNEILITYQAETSTPITYQNILSKTLKNKSTGQEPSFIFSETPSITTHSDAGNTQGYSYFRLRGIDQTRINFSLDGVPLNEPEDQGAYFSNYPDILNSLSKIQIQRGVGTSKNGVSSYAGSVQLFSPNLFDSTKIGFGFGAGSYNSIRIFGEFNSGIKNKKAIYIRASQIFSQGYKYHSSNNSQSVFISSGLFYDKTNWKINLLFGRQQNQLAWLGVLDSLIKLDRKTNANKNENDKFIQCLYQLQNKWQINNNSILETSFYYTFLKGNYDFDLNNFLGIPSTSELYNYAFLSHLTGFYSNYVFSKKNINFTGGIHSNTYTRRHTGSEKTLGELYTNTGKKNEVSFFAKINYCIKGITIFSDLQYRYTSFKYNGNIALNKQSWHFINPKLGISYKFKRNNYVYYSAGLTGKEPTRNDIFGGNDNLLADSLDNAIIFINSPEYVINQEIGFRHHSKKLNVDVNIYHLKFKNEIVLNGKFGPNGLALTNNVDRSFRMGLEWTIHYKVCKYFSIENNSSFNYSKIKEMNIKFTPILTPNIIINQSFTYTYKGFSMSLSGRYQSKSYIDFSNANILKGYFLLNSSIQYEIKGFQLTFNLNNLTNTKYFNNGYVDVDGSNKYFVQAPINFYLGIKYNF